MAEQITFTVPEWVEPMLAEAAVAYGRYTGGRALQLSDVAWHIFMEAVEAGRIEAFIARYRTNIPDEGGPTSADL